nr:glutaredoxin family protein [Aromatoleum petrolei]
MVRELTVMSREWCHLCHELVDRLLPLAAELGWRVRILDVDADPALEAKWDELVPIVLAGDTELCHYHLDEGAIRAYCGRFPLESAV